MGVGNSASHPYHLGPSSSDVGCPAYHDVETSSTRGCADSKDDDPVVFATCIGEIPKDDGATAGSVSIQQQHVDGLLDEVSSLESDKATCLVVNRELCSIIVELRLESSKIIKSNRRLCSCRPSARCYLGSCLSVVD